LELLVVVSIIVILMALVVPAMSSIKGAGDFTRAVYDLKGILDQARAYAVANNTHVWVGFFEEDSGSTPAISGVGRIVVAAVASKNGLRGYDPSTPITALDSTNLLPLDKLRRLDSLHLVSLTGTSTQGNMTRPAISDSKYELGSASCTACTSFSWPLQGTVQYVFSKIISFDPQGSSRIQYSGIGDYIPVYIEIGLQPSHGNTLPATSTNPSQGNQAAVQINGMTGATRVYRP
jgi:Tfp pilus assembly protein FimT